MDDRKNNCGPPKNEVLRKKKQEGQHTTSARNQGSGSSFPGNRDRGVGPEKGRSATSIVQSVGGGLRMGESVLKQNPEVTAQCFDKKVLRQTAGPGGKGGS